MGEQLRLGHRDHLTTRVKLAKPTRLNRINNGVVEEPDKREVVELFESMFELAAARVRRLVVQDGKEIAAFEVSVRSAQLAMIASRAHMILKQRPIQVYKTS